MVMVMSEWVCVWGGGDWRLALIFGKGREIRHSVELAESYVAASKKNQ